ncbi:MAG: hypothetical protein AB1393_01960 [Candidatus Edwardsbacteria bacterium]
MSDKHFKGSVHKFKTITEQNDWELKKRLENGEKLEEIDRFEYIRLKVKPYAKGIYRFKTLREKQTDEFIRIMTAWEKLTENEKNR